MRSIVATVAALLFIVAPLQSQESGTITGRVLQSETGRPLSSVQVYIDGIDLGVLTQQNGRYLLQNVPEGTHAVTAERIGYRSQTAQITVTAAEAVVQDFRLTEEALQLDEVVVTGTVGGTQRRALGNVVGRVDAAEIAETAPAMNIQQLIGPREPSVSFSRVSGNIGGGSEIRIRGTGSFNLGVQPLIYVDGIRVDNEVGIGPSTYGGQQGTRLDDFNPEEIESIEIIKGPAAATLYGTEASAGVIQIITKRGQTGAPQFDLTVRQGTNWMMDPAGRMGDFWGIDEDTGEPVSFNIYEQEKSAGREFFHYGHTQEYNASMRGGTDDVRYYISAGWNDEGGIVSYNWNQRMTLRGNISIVASPTVSVDLSTGFVDGTTSYMQQDSRAGVIDQTWWSQPENRDTRTRGFFEVPPEEIATVEATREYTRFTGSATVSHTPWESFTHRLIMGTDVANDLNKLLFPRHPDGTAHFFGERSLGRLEEDKPTVSTVSLDYSGSYTLDWNEELSFTSSYGVQYNQNSEQNLSSQGRVFPSPAIRNMAGAAVVETTEIEGENKSLGLYLQEEVSIGDRIFVTGAVRADDNSAFGADFDAAVYPKLSATWVVSDESFWEWGDWINSLRLRSAWGKAGRQPATFAAVTLYNPTVGLRGATAIEQAVLGNEDVGPEVSTELELGFDAAFFDDRISTEFTFYDQSVKDALMDVPVPPSSGFPGAQSLNLGELSVWGWELSMNARAIERSNLSLDLGGVIAHNTNRIDDLGGATPTTQIREGLPYPNFHHHIIVDAEWGNGTGGPGAMATDILCDGGTGPDGQRPGGDPVPCDEAPQLFVGNANPLYEGNVNATLTLFNALRLYALVDWKADYWEHASFLVGCQHWCWPTARKRILGIDPIYNAAHQLGRGAITTSRYSEDYRGGFAKLREVSLGYTLPDNIGGRLGASRMSITVSGRELWTIWTKQDHLEGVKIPDPELGSNPSSEVSSGIGPVPPLSSLLVTVRASF